MLFLHLLSSPSVSSPLLVKMKRQGKWNRSGGRQGSGKWPSVSHSVHPAHSPINLTYSQEDLPPSSPSRKPVPNSAFQTTHFKFQSNLNRPLITAHITIILSEEENQISPLSCIAPNPSHRSEHSMDEGDQGIRQVGELSQEHIQAISIPPQDDSGAIDMERDIGTTNIVQANPSNATDGNANLRIGSTCRDVEKIHGEDAEAD